MRRLILTAVALLGAAALGDIGKHFPDTSDEFKGIDSRILLRVSSAAIRSTSFKMRTHRKVISSRFPIGVAHRYNVPAISCSSLPPDPACSPAKSYSPYIALSSPV